MKLEIFQKNDRTRLDLIRQYDFVQYVDEFSGIGTFTMTIPYTEASLQYLVRDNYILFEDGVMGIIKYRSKKTETSTTLEIKGFLLNKILEYRSFLRTHEYSGTVTTIARTMVSDLMIANEDSRRNIDIVSLAKDVQYIPEAPKISMQNTGGELSAVLSQMLQTIGYGYSLYPNIIKYDENSDKPTNVSSFEFRVHKPVDRTINNTEGNVPIVFATELNNISTFTYIEDSTSYRSTAIVAGEGTGADRVLAEAGDVEASGLDRIELYVDARDLQTEKEDGSTIAAEDYRAMLVQRGNEYLQDHLVFVLYDGTIISGKDSYRYGIDFQKGDYVSLVDKQLNIYINAQIATVTKSATRTGEILDIKFGYERSTVQQLIRKRGIV